MEYIISYLDAAGAQVERVATVEEAASIDSERAERNMVTIAQYTDAIQSMLDTEARTRNYDSIMSACTYASSANAKFGPEGMACVAWRDAVWSESYVVMAEVEAHTRGAPTIAELLALMPSMAWPA